jgi:hypothetical protein
LVLSSAVSKIHRLAIAKLTSDSSGAAIVFATGDGSSKYSTASAVIATLPTIDTGAFEALNRTSR